MLLVGVMTLLCRGSVVGTNERWNALREQAEIREGTERVRYYDELLTNTARIAALTGDIDLVERYEAAVPELDAVLAELASLSKDENARQAVAGISEANAARAAIEDEALSFTRAGRGPEAEAVLTSPRYESEKLYYAAALAESLETLRGDAEDRASAADTHRL